MMIFRAILTPETRVKQINFSVYIISYNCMLYAGHTATYIRNKEKYFFTSFEESILQVTKLAYEVKVQTCTG